MKNPEHKTRLDTLQQLQRVELSTLEEALGAAEDLEKVRRAAFDELNARVAAERGALESLGALSDARSVVGLVSGHHHLVARRQQLRVLQKSARAAGDTWQGQAAAVALLREQLRQERGFDKALERKRVEAAQSSHRDRTRRIEEAQEDLHTSHGPPTPTRRRR